MKYDYFTLSLLASLERYLPYMTSEDLTDILEYGISPTLWKIQVWETLRKENAGRVEGAVKGAILRQK